MEAALESHYASSFVTMVACLQSATAQLQRKAGYSKGKRTLKAANFRLSLHGMTTVIA